MPDNCAESASLLKVVSSRPAASSRRDIVEISLFSFAADVVYGIVAPTFSLYVRHLGGSAIVIGVLAGTVGVTRLTGGLPVGALSDRLGRKRVLVGGALLFGAACLLFTVPAEPLLLIGPRILLGLAMLATFPLGVAYIADVVPEARRTLAISIYVSAQGAGYTLGPLLGSWLADAYGYHVAYDVAAAIAVATALLAARRLRSSSASGPVSRSAIPPSGLLRRELAAPALANVFVMLMFSGAVLPFLALLGTTVGLGTFGVGALYAVRSVASVLARLPAGLLAGRLSNAQLMLGAVSLDAVGALCIAWAGSAPQLFAAVTVDGIAFGVFLTAGQSMVAEHAPSGRRGAAIGGFAMAGAIGETAGAFSFGAVAELLTLRAVFFIAALLLALCVPACSWLLWGLQRAHRKH